MFSKFVSMNDFKLYKNLIKTTKYCNKTLINLKFIQNNDRNAKNYLKYKVTVD
jgi:hypothetical protein